MKQIPFVPLLRISRWGTALLLVTFAAPLAAQVAPASQGARFG